MAKNLNLIKSVFLTFIFIFTMFMLSFIEKDYINVDATAPTGVYHSLTTDVSEVISGEDMQVKIRINNLASIPNSRKDIQAYIGILYYDSSKFDVLTGNVSEAEEMTYIDDSSIDIGEYNYRVTLPETGEIEVPTKPNTVVCRFKTNDPNYIYIEVMYSLDEQKILTHDADVVTITFTAKEDASGKAEFYMVDDEHKNYNIYRPYLVLEGYTIDNTIARQTVDIISNNASITSIKVLDNDTGIEYLAKKTSTRYEVAIPVETKNIDIIVTPTCEFSSVNGNTKDSIFEAIKVYIFTIIAQDGETTSEVELYVRRMKDVNTLQEVQLINSKLTNGVNFLSINNSTNKYILEINYTESLILIPQVALNSGAKVYFDNKQVNNVNLTNLTENEPTNISLIVEAENGRQNEYEFTIIMVGANNDTSVDFAKTDPDVAPTITNNEYTFIYPYSSNNKVRLIIKPTNANTLVQFENPTNRFTKENDIFISDLLTLVPGTTSRYIIVFTSEKGNTEKYTINLHLNSIDTKSGLESITINGVEIPNFSPEKTKYNLGVYPNTVSNLKINAKAISEYSQIIGTGDNIKLSVGSDVIIITVKSQTPIFGEEQKETKYYLTYYREEPLSDDCFIESILINGQGIKGFDNSIKEYSFTFPYETSSIIIEALLDGQSIKASLSGDLGFKNLLIGKQQLIINCVSESKIVTDQFVLNITRLGPNQDTSLKKVIIDDYELQKINNEYIYEVPYNKESIFINVVSNNSNAILNGIGLKALELGENIFNIRVITQDESVYSEYSIKVIRNYPSSNGKLNKLEIPENDSIVFDKDQKTYSFTVPWETLSITVIAEAEDSKARILPYEEPYYEDTFNLNYGLNRMAINIEAEDGSITTYTIMVTRTVKYNNDSSLKELQVEGYDPFTLKDDNEKVRTFNLFVPYTQESIKIKALANSDKSLIVGATTHILSVGVNQIDITCFAEDKTSTIYRIFVFRERLSDNNYLSNISINELPSFTFKQDTEQYFLEFSKRITQLNITAVPAHEESTYKISGNKDLKEGINRIEIQVFAPDNTVRVYTIFVTIQPKVSSKAAVYGLVTSGFLNIGLLGTTIIRLFRRRKFKL